MCRLSEVEFPLVEKDKGWGSRDGTSHERKGARAAETQKISRAGGVTAVLSRKSEKEEGR